MHCLSAKTAYVGLDGVVPEVCLVQDLALKGLRASLIRVQRPCSQGIPTHRKNRLRG